MFQKDINRDINGVVKVAQDDEKSLEQELGEYIITRELRRHFTTFFDNYSRTIDVPTDKIGVWISGFFGSGKSHFLKMLSYLLSNREVGGKRVVDIFKEKFDDSMTHAVVSRCAGIPTESILFNIDVEGPINKDKTAVLRVFTKMFYNHLGYYGEDLKIAKLERHIDEQGKTGAFREAFERVNGTPWLENRDSYAFFEDDIVKVLQSVAGMSEAAARNWFNGEESAGMSIGQLVSEIKKYADGKGKNFRLLFMVDEVGQYIGDDGDLMINLQSIVEELGAKCRGKVWVMVTSQEAIDSVVKISGDDFSKIQGRFDTRLSLSSSSVDEVIKKRVLAKTEDADRLLRMVYDKERAVLKNLFTFNNPILDIKGYADGGDFSATYPFVPYQFIVIQKVLAEIRKHGNSGKHLSGGERSMLSGFQEAAQKIQEKDENALVPFHQFYDTVHTFLESTIRRVIDRCRTAADNRDGVEPQDVDVLKLLYLVRYIDDVRTNIDNIAILMIGDVRADKIALRSSVADSLERLLAQNYIARSGDAYFFLTDEEQDVANDIRNTPVDGAAIVQSIGQAIFGELYPSKKFRLGKYDFAYDQYIDDTLIGPAAGGIRLRFLTAASGGTQAGDQKWMLESHANNEAIVLLSDENPYFEELEEAAKIRKYVKQRNVSQLPESLQDIVRKRQQEARRLEEQAQKSLGEAIQNAVFYVHGEKIEARRGGAREKLDFALTQLVESVFFKLNLVNDFAESDADILEILNGGAQAAVNPLSNGDALNEISQWLESRHQSRQPVSMGDVQRRYGGIPYGWREIDIAALAARLTAAGKISIKYGGALVAKDDRKLPDYLRKKSETDKAAVVWRTAPSEDLMRKAAAFLRDYSGAMDIPSDEDGLTRFAVQTLEEKAAHYSRLLENEYSRASYPQKETVTAARDLVNDILSRKKDSAALLNYLIQKQNDLADSAEDMEDIENFFKSQKEIFDAALELRNSLRNERDYFASGSGAGAKIDGITAILEDPKPYGRIKDLTELMQGVRADHGELLEQKKEEVRELITRCMGDIHTLAGTGARLRETVGKADEHFTQKRQEVAQVASLNDLDAMITRLPGFRDQVCGRIEAIMREGEGGETPGGDKNAPAKPRNVATVRRGDIFPARELRSREEIDRYIDRVREKLYETLTNRDGVQIS
jgi:hypothetical protein